VASPSPTATATPIPAPTPVPPALINPIDLLLPPADLSGFGFTTTLSKPAAGASLSGSLGHATASFGTPDGLVKVVLDAWVDPDAPTASSLEGALLNQAKALYPGALVTSTDIGVPCDVVDGGNSTVGRVRLLAVWSHAEIVERVTVTGDHVDFGRLYLTNMARNQDSRSYRFIAPSAGA
jgi:hypothetical protein